MQRRARDVAVTELSQARLVMLWRQAIAGSSCTQLPGVWTLAPVSPGNGGLTLGSVPSGRNVSGYIGRVADVVIGDVQRGM